MHFLNHDIVQLLGMQQQGNLVDILYIHGRDDRTLFHIGKQGHLAALGRRQRTIGPAQQDVRLDANGTQFLHRVLGRFGLDFAGNGNIGNQRQVHEQGLLVPQFGTHLADGLQKRQRLDITHGAANLDHGNIGIVRTAADTMLDFIRDMRDHLHRGAKIVTPAFLANHVLIDLAGGEVVVFPHRGANEAFIVTEIQVRLRAIVGHEYFAMLKRAHGTGIHIDIGIQL